eukprot:TRINITY_DN21515_c0_g1_i1.p1 TRINITY_DN21515_c0_g1~~TRINITY_DN21515_c0_g1_i1.p1  ORF type:complete len:623 (-),score=140.13 TRINITY_DN21515_c0_g1_i1:424-2292(-)
MPTIIIPEVVSSLSSEHEYALPPGVGVCRRTLPPTRLSLLSPLPPASSKPAGSARTAFGLFGGSSSNEAKDDAPDEEPEEARAEPKWQDLLQIYYRKKVTQARAFERDAALRRVVEERKTARAMELAHGWNDVSVALSKRMKALTLNAGENPSPEQSGEMQEISRQKTLVTDRNTDATETSLMFDHSRQAADAAQLRALTLEAWAFKGKAAAKEDMESSFKAQRNMIPGKAAVDVAGQIITDRQKCRTEGMEFEDGKGCFVPGNARPPAPAEVAAFRDVKRAKALEHGERQRIDNLSDDFHKSEREVRALKSKYAGDNSDAAKQAIAAAEQRTASAKATLQKEKKVLADDVSAVLAKEEKALSTTKESEALDQKFVDADKAEEHDAETAALALQKEAETVEEGVAKIDDAEALQLHAAKTKLGKDPAKGRLVAQEEGQEKRLGKDAKKMAAAIKHHNMKRAADNLVDEQKGERAKADIERRLLIEGASNGLKTSKPKPSKFSGEAKAAEELLQNDLNKEAQQEARRMNALGGEAAAGANVNAEEQREEQMRQEIEQMRFMANADAKTSELAVFSTPWPPPGLKTAMVSEAAIAALALAPMRLGRSGVVIPSPCLTLKLRGFL